MGLLERADWKARWIADPESLERPTEPLVIRFPARQARYLRLDVTRLGKPLKEGWPDPVSRLQLAELEAYGGGELRSRGAAATASESYTVDGVWEPRFLTDGTRDSNRDPRGYTSFERHGQDLDAPIWLEIDLGAVTEVDEVRLYARTDALTADNRDGQLPGGLHAPHAHRGRRASGARRIARPARRRPSRRPKPAGAAASSRATSRSTAGIRSARLYAAGLGVYEARLNGRKVGDAVLEPANTDYRKRVLYGTYDVTDQLRARREHARLRARQRHLQRPGRLGSLHEVHGLDGPAQAARPARGHATPTAAASVIASDDSWQARSGPTTFSNWYGGEDYDARRDSATPEPWHAVADLGAPDGAARAERTAGAARAGAGDRDGRSRARRSRRASGCTTSGATSPAGPSSRCAAPRAGPR